MEVPDTWTILRARACRWGLGGQLEGGEPPQGAEGAWWRARAERRGRPGPTDRRGRLKNPAPAHPSNPRSCPRTLWWSNFGGHTDRFINLGVINGQGKTPDV